MNTQECIESIKKETGISYIDVVCYQDHKEIFRYGSGSSGKEQLLMYSCGKPITVTAALRLIEQGLLGLDDPVCRYLPEVKNAFILDEKGGKRVVGELMTIRHLFTMSAGLTYNLNTPPIQKLIKESNGQAKLRDFISAFIQTPLVFTPGKRFFYSLCHDVLAAVVEEVAKMSFSQFVKEQIFTPLHMSHSYFDNSEPPTAQMYTAFKDGRIEETNEGKILLPTPVYESGGGGLSSTVEDYIRFADALACGGEAANGYRVLNDETVRLLRTTQMPYEGDENGFTCAQGEEYGYGLGVRVRQNDTPWGLAKGEFGWDGAAGSYALIDPARRISVFIGMHLRNWPFNFKG